MVDPLLPDAEKVAALRELLPATGAGIYLDTATQGPLPGETAAAMREAEEWELRVGRATAGREEDVAQRAEEARAVVAALITADPAEISLSHGLGEALAGAIWATDWKPGDRILTTSVGVPATVGSLSGLLRPLDVTHDVAYVGVGNDDAQIAELLNAAMTPRTRALVVPHVAASTGTRMPLHAVADLSRRHGASLIVDASQAAGAVPLEAAGLGADFMCLATDTWALGPEGTGALWSARRGEGDVGTAFVGPDGLPRTTLLGLARSVGWLAMYVGLDWALDRSVRLAAWLHAALAELDGVELLTPVERMATIVTFRLTAWSPEEVAEELGRRVFAILRPIPALGALRASVAWFNSEPELERFVRAVAELGRYTPATLPRRPSLTVM
ncbi:MAG: aminotransferase class V-fold PLP-dependent enzyme [Chloroflexota bacterium]|nr:aminotransferase class V-fold PLP-dependent enzyme [Chloroflexota bacterium]